MTIYDKYWGYIPLSEGNLDEIWNTGTIVLDTNILLNLYRLSSSATDEFIKILESNSERVVVVCGKINLHTIAAQKYITPQAA